jgi:membrane fusion protein (multidrug efflux system)
LTDETARINQSATPLVPPLQTIDEPRFHFDNQGDLPAPKNFKLMLKRAALVALIVIAGMGLAKLTHDWWVVGRFSQSTDDAYVGGDVTVIAPKVSGFVAQLAVADNQWVHAGDLLIKLDDRDYRAALEKAQAAVTIQQATLGNLDATGHLQEAVIAQARAGIAAADAEITRTHDDQVRAKQLISTGVESTQEFQQADAAYQEALAAGDKARATLTAAERQLEVIASQRLQARAAETAAVAERDLAQLNLSYTELRAPIDGIIGNRSAQVGAYASIGAQLISLVPAHGLWIDANFKENQLGRMRPGSPASVRVDLISGKIFPGHVASIAPATGAEFSVLPPENATGNFTKIVQRVAVRIVLDDEAAALGQLRPGLSVTARVDTRVKGKAGL